MNYYSSYGMAVTDWIEQTPDHDIDSNLTVGELRAALADLPDDAEVVTGYYMTCGVHFSPSTNLVCIDNSD